MKQSIYQEKNAVKAVMMAALPAMLGQAATLIYNIADTWFVSLAKDADMIAAVTLCTPILLIIMSIANIFGSGGGSLIARYLGADQKGNVQNVASYCFYCSLLFGVLFAIVGFLLSGQIATICGADSQNLDYTIDYLHFIFLGTPAIMIFNGMQNIFRSAGYIRQSTLGLLIGNGTNIVLDYVFIIWLSIGTAGAALATSIGFLLSSVYFIACMNHFSRKSENLLPLNVRFFRPTKAITANICKVGIPGALITILLSVSNIILNNFIGMYSSDAVAAYGITYKIFMVPVLLSVGISTGVGPLIGFHFGGNNIPNMKKVLRASTVFGILTGSIFLLLFFMLGEFFTGLFLHTDALIQRSAYFLRIVVISSPFLGISNIITAYFQAIGKGLPSLAITLLRNVVLFISALILFNRLWGLTGIIAAQPTAEILTSLICIIIYMRDKNIRKPQQSQAHHQMSRNA